MGLSRMLPVTDDRETAPFFEAAKQGRLVIRRCKDCGNGIHPPTAHCPHCNGWNTSWEEVTGRGRLHTWTTVAHQVHPAYPVPYTLVVVELDDVPRVRLMGTLPNTPDLTPGMPMKVVFREEGKGAVLPQWEPI